MNVIKFLAALLQRVDRRAIYITVAAALSLPLYFKITLKPSPLPTAAAFYKTIESLPAEKGNLVLISMDWGPNTKGENMPQTIVVIEHLLRRHIPFAVITLYAQAAPFLDQLPQEVVQKLMKEIPTEHWEYGKDWVNWGYIPNATVMIQNIAKTSDLIEQIKTDAYGTPLKTLSVMDGVKTIKNISALVQITSLVGTLSTWIQFFQGNDYRPPFLHGCTSISIPDAFTYYASKQLVGLFEGLAGASAYEQLLSEAYPQREPSDAILNNTSLAFAHLLIIAFIILGNIGVFLGYLIRRSEGST